MDRMDVMAWLLAARHDAAIEQTAEYAEARGLLESDPELSAAFEQEKAYYDEHEDYLDFIRLPDEARARMQEALESASSPAGSWIAFPWRPLAMAASLLAVVTLGMLALRPGESSSVAQAAPVTFESFRQFAADQVEGGFVLDFRSADAASLLSWLRDEEAPSASVVDHRLAALPTMGCKVLNWDGQDVSLMCFEVAEGTIHLFIAPASALPSTELAAAAHAGVYTERETVSWADDTNAYVLVAHDPGQKLTGFSG